MMVENGQMPRKGPGVHEGETWAYRKRAVDGVTPVRVVKLGTAKPPRVLVRYLDEKFEGSEEWVPPGRLHVPWADVDAWQAREDRWKEVGVPSVGIDGTPEFQAAVTFIDVAIPPDVLDISWDNLAGVLHVVDAPKAADLLGVDPIAFLEDKRAFTDDDGQIVVPWTTTLPLVRSAASKYAEALLAELEKEDRRATNRAIYGEYWGGRSHSSYASPEICAEVDAKYVPGRRVLREWCGGDAVERHDELIALREEVLRLGMLAERAISALEEAGISKVAESLKSELGVPIETLRARREGLR
jgi:hypothetical protein